VCGLDLLEYGSGPEPCQTVVDTVMKIQFDKKTANILNSLVTISFSIVTLLHEVSHSVT
jgi:hypothetical protein